MAVAGSVNVNSRVARHKSRGLLDEGRGSVDGGMCGAQVDVVVVEGRGRSYNRGCCHHGCRG